MDNTQAWIKFKRNLNDFSILNWEIEEPLASVNFLDMMLTIVDDRIEFKTYHKGMNM